MLDVVLYGNDERGRLDLIECRFEDLLELSRFVAGGSREWSWAEVIRLGPDEFPAPGTKMVRHSIARLREMARHEPGVPDDRDGISGP